MPNANDINDIGSEAGVVASIILNPELVFHSEALTPHHFTNEANAYMYYAISQLAKRDIAQVDAYNIIHVLHANSSIRDMVDKVLTIPLINDFISNAPSIARMTVEEYKMVCDNVLNAAFRRDTYAKLVECEHLCFNDNVQDIEQKIYSALDDVMMEFSTNTSVPQYKDVVDDYWAEIQARQESGMAGIPFKFPALNDYAMIEPGELFIFAAEQKQGKSMMLLNCAVDLLRRGYSVMYIDSELSSRLFTMRLLAHLAKIEFNRVRAGCYNDEEKQRIEEAIAWLERMDEQLYNEYRGIMAMFKQTIEDVHKFQDEETGMFWQVMDHPGVEGNYLETSGTALFAYAVLKGVRLGYLPKRMAAWAEKAFYGTCDKYLSKNPDGSLQLDGICLVAGLGGKDHRDGSLAYYFSEPVVCNDAKGVGPLVLAYTEMIARK